MILIDAVYLVSPGGVALFQLLTEKLQKSKVDVFYLIDERLREHLSLYGSSFSFIKPKTLERVIFYHNNPLKFTSVICLANVPPPINLKIPTHIYFHNDLLLDTFKSNLNFKSKIILWIKRKYIQIKNKGNYHWHVQTPLIREKLNKHIHVPAINIKVTPFFQELKPKPLKSISTPSFIYVAAYSPHKNHKNLIRGFIQATQKTNTHVNLSLTLDIKTTQTLLTNYKVPDNLNIKSLGMLSKEELIEKYCEHQYLIYPSLKESFGLPLVEAAQLGLKVFAADLPYTYEVIEPSLAFDPLSVSSICEIILNAINLEELKSTELRIENKMEALIENLF